MPCRRLHRVDCVRHHARSFSPYFAVDKGRGRLCGETRAHRPQHLHWRLQLEASTRDSLRGFLHLTSPLNVDAVVSGVVRRDSLILLGSYTAANGCAGELRASLSMPTDRAGDGPFQLADKCAGTLNGVMTVTR